MNDTAAKIVYITGYADGKIRTFDTTEEAEAWVNGFESGQVTHMDEDGREWEVYVRFPRVQWV